MMLPGDAPAPAAIEMVDGVPCGWCLGRESWIAHREFYRQFNRSMQFGEYSKLLRARGADAACLSRSLNVWRLIAAQGETVIVQRTSNKIRQILPGNWTPPSARSKPVPKRNNSTAEPKTVNSPPSVPCTGAEVL